MRSLSPAVSCILLLAACSYPPRQLGDDASVRRAASPDSTDGAPSRSPSDGPPVVPHQPRLLTESDSSPTKPIVGRALKCQDGKILMFKCRDVELLSFLPVKTLGARTLGAVWGWTDSVTGREFVIASRQGSSEFGDVIFIEVTDPLNPRYLGAVANYGGEINVYKHYMLSPARVPAELGIAIFDLTQLLTVDSVPVTFQPTIRYREVEAVHTITVNSATGFAYLNWSSRGGTTCGGGLHMVDIRDPMRPTFAGCYTEPQTGLSRLSPMPGIHDTQCVIYHGPDQRYRDRELCFNSAVATFSIADVTDKRQPKTLSISPYPNVTFTHQGWLSEDQRYFFLVDEFDEHPLQKLNNWLHIRSRIIVFDVTDLEDPVVTTEFFGTPGTADHNLFIRGQYAYQGDYAGGLRIIDVRDPKHLHETGYFFFPPTSLSWNVYPYFTRNAGVVAFALASQGLAIVRHRGTP